MIIDGMRGTFDLAGAGFDAFAEVSRSAQRARAQAESELVKSRKPATIQLCQSYLKATKIPDPKRPSESAQSCEILEEVWQISRRSIS